jgi:diacylglycerol kinase (ATP)
MVFQIMYLIMCYLHILAWILDSTKAISENMNLRNIQIVVNPMAGNRRAEIAVRAILRRLNNNRQCNIKISHTKDKDDATSITMKAISDHAAIIVAVGGDGTINEVINGFFENEKLINPSCELGIINCGTGKGLASSLKIPVPIDRQIDLLLGSSHIEPDIGFISCRNKSGEVVKRFFINECQIGIGSKVASIVGRKFKMLGGRIAFGLAATILAMTVKAVEVEISFNEGTFEEYYLIGLVVGNGTECAGGMKLTPFARMDDGLFDVLLINEMGHFKRLMNLPKVYSGTHLNSDSFSIRRCKSLRIRSKHSILLEADGEILGYSPCEINIVPSAFKVKAG